MRTPTVLMDRDGVLVEDRPDYLLRIEDMRLERGAVAGIELVSMLGFQLIVVTNQACVGKGLLSMAELDVMHRELNRRLQGRIARFYVCPHLPEDGCRCRKPEPGLIRSAQCEFGFDPAITWFVGDAIRDVQAAQAAGCQAALVRSGKGAMSAASLPEIPLFQDLLDFARFLQSQRGIQV